MSIRSEMRSIVSELVEDRDSVIAILLLLVGGTAVLLAVVVAAIWIGTVVA